MLVTEGTLSAVLHGGVASSLHGGGGAVVAMRPEVTAMGNPVELH